MKKSKWLKSCNFGLTFGYTDLPSPFTVSSDHSNPNLILTNVLTTCEENLNALPTMYRPHYQASIIHRLQVKVYILPHVTVLLLIIRTNESGLNATLQVIVMSLTSYSDDIGSMMPYVAFTRNLMRPHVSRQQEIDRHQQTLQLSNINPPISWTDRPLEIYILHVRITRRTIGRVETQRRGALHLHVADVLSDNSF